jgi:WD40 repeat protein
MDASARLDKIVVGMRSGLITCFSFTFVMNVVTEQSQVQFGFHTQPVLCVKISGDGTVGISGGFDPYLALWDVPNQLLL